MPTYTFEAVDQKGKPHAGKVDAKNEQEAAEMIRSKGLYVTRVAAEGGAPSRVAPAARKHGMVLFKRRPSRKHLTQFTRQFATLVDAGLPIVRSLDILERQFPTGMLPDAIGSVKEDVQGGSALSESMGKHPKVWDSLYVSMVRAGEAGGVLDAILNRLAEYMEKAYRLRQQIIRAMVYPAAVMTIAVGIVAFLVIFIIPRFQTMFEEMTGDKGLPLPTQLLMSATNLVRTQWWLPVSVIILLFIALRLIGSNAKGRYVIDNIKLRIPIFGLILRKTSVSSFARTLGTLLAAGVPILDALNIIRGTMRNSVFSQAIGDVQTAIREGDAIAEPLRVSGVFDDMVVNMVDVGEETGELEKMLLKIADTYDEEVDTLVGGLMGLLEPLIVIFMGVTVGFIVVALFMPLIAIITELGQAT